MLADVMTLHWFDMIPKSIPTGDNREVKYTNSATLSINALHSRQYENIMPHIMVLYKKLPAYISNSTIADNDIVSLCIECCRTFFPNYIFEMMVDNSEGMRTFFNSVLAGAFSQSLAIIKDFSKSDILLILKNDGAFRKYTQNAIFETIIAYRNTVHDRAIQSDVGRTETPTMLKDEIIRLKSRISKLESTLKTKVVECNTTLTQLASARSELTAVTQEVNLSAQLDSVLAALQQLPQPTDNFTSVLESHMSEHDMRINKLSMDILSIFDHTEKAHNNIRETIELKLTSFKSMMSTMSGKIATIANSVAEFSSKLEVLRPYAQSAGRLHQYTTDQSPDMLLLTNEADDMPSMYMDTASVSDTTSAMDIVSDTMSVMSDGSYAEAHVVNATEVAASVTDKRKRQRKKA